MTSPITAIIFDFGNVFVKWDPHGVYGRFFSTPEAVDSFLEEIHFNEWNALQDAGRPFKEGVAALSKEFPQYAELIQAYETFWEDSITEAIQGTIDILRELKAEGWPLYLLSNFSSETFPLMLKKYDFLQLFDDLVISGDVQLIKPDPSIFEFTLKKIQRRANECLFIDDSPANIRVADQMGFQTIQFYSPQQLSNDLKKFK